MNTERKIILDLCGGTGAWSRPYAEHPDEYDVRLITLPNYDVRTYIPPNNVYGILAAPPCTVFSLAAWKIPIPEKDFGSGMEIVRACYDIIWKCQSKGLQVKFWALENPMGYMRKFLGDPKFAFQGWEFGEVSRRYATKRTDIWGYFKVPKTTVKERDYSLHPPTRGSSLEWYTVKERPVWLKDKKLNRADLRAITPPGFAKAFFKANR